MNLYDKMTKECTENFLKFYAGYPNLLESKTTELKSMSSWMQLSFILAYDLCTANNLPLGISEVYSLFDEK